MRRMFNPGHEGKLRDLGLLVLRVGFAGFLALTHGYGKLSDMLTGGRSGFPDPLGLGSGLSLGLATFAEFFCALALAVGFMSRLATVPLVILFSVAFFIFHAADPFEEKELPFLYLMVFVALLATGPGRFSLDRFLRRR